MRRHWHYAIPLLVIFNLVAIVTVIVIPTKMVLKEWHNQKTCRDNLTQIWPALKKYQAEHHLYPRRLDKLYPKYIDERSTLSCPNDPLRRKNSYQLFYVCPEPENKDGMVMTGCTFHPPNRKLLLYIDGVVKENPMEDTQIVVTQGQVRVRKLDAPDKWVPASTGMRLQLGEILRTEDGRAAIQFMKSRSLVDVLENTTITPKISAREPKTTRLVQILNLARGRLWVWVAPHDFTTAESTFLIITPFGIVSTRGESIYIKVTKESAKVLVARGRAEIKVAGTRKIIKTGQTAKMGK